MIRLNFGDGLDASKGYINTFDLAQEQANNKSAVFEPWAWADLSSIKDNSVCSAKFGNCKEITSTNFALFTIFEAKDSSVN